MKPAEPELPWRDYMRVALGLLGWSPDTFWAATREEFWAALDGCVEARGGRAPPPPLREELEELMARFPD